MTPTDPSIRHPQAFRAHGVESRGPAGVIGTFPGASPGLSLANALGLNPTNWITTIAKGGSAEVPALRVEPVNHKRREES
jgi:hypothetical protein